MTRYTSLLLLCLLSGLWTSCQRPSPHDAPPPEPLPGTQRTARSFTHPLLHDLQTYCYACHHDAPGGVFDKFSPQPAFFAAASEAQALQNVREVAGRAIRYLRSTTMPKAMSPPLAQTQRRALIKAIKTLAETPPTGTPPVETTALARVQAVYERDLQQTLVDKCGVCHEQTANGFQKALFGGAIRLAQHAWDTSTGYPFGGDYRQDPLLQLSNLEVAVVMRTMPPTYYAASFPDRRLTEEESARVRAWIAQARAVYQARP